MKSSLHAWRQLWLTQITNTDSMSSYQSSTEVIPNALRLLNFANSIIPIAPPLLLRKSFPEALWHPTVWTGSVNGSLLTRTKSIKCFLAIKFAIVTSKVSTLTLISMVLITVISNVTSAAKLSEASTMPLSPRSQAMLKSVTKSPLSVL